MATLLRDVALMHRTTCSLRSWIKGFVGRRAEARALLRPSLVAMLSDVVVGDQWAGDVIAIYHGRAQSSGSSQNVVVNGVSWPIRGR
jgi:hypothetical protein